LSQDPVHEGGIVVKGGPPPLNGGGDRFEISYTMSLPRGGEVLLHRLKEQKKEIEDEEDIRCIECLFDDGRDRAGGCFLSERYHAQRCDL
jgi:hypothetical protein